MAVSMATCRCAGKADTRPVITMVLVSGADGWSALRRRRRRSEDTPGQPPRAVLFYTLPELLPALTQELTAAK
jgi:hypothetical protein